ncbi:hypothetical protein EG329_013287 [Mollisiaceae sp. DMI_Dod_QoI]|nr:hypothetical protein EG329_013287 [Helotiales sp. DMI_Dod_QoI]
MLFLPPAAFRIALLALIGETSAAALQTSSDPLIDVLDTVMVSFNATGIFNNSHVQGNAFAYRWCLKIMEGHVTGENQTKETSCGVPGVIASINRIIPNGLL